MIGKPLKVMIVGAGTGGFCLAQGLKLDDVGVEVSSVILRRRIVCKVTD